MRQWFRTAEPLGKRLTRIETHTHTHTHTHTPVLTGLKETHIDRISTVYDRISSSHLDVLGVLKTDEITFLKRILNYVLQGVNQGLLFRCFKFTYIFNALFDIQNTCNQWNISVYFAMFCNGSNFCDLLFASLDDELSASKMGRPYI